MPFHTVRKGKAATAHAIFFFKEVDVALFIFLLLELTIDTVFAIGKSAAHYENSINILL